MTKIQELLKNSSIDDVKIFDLKDGRYNIDIIQYGQVEDIISLHVDKNDTHDIDILIQILNIIKIKIESYE